jgi:hypothetical protein
MSLRHRLVEHILAAVLLCAALLAPSLASAHASHSHHAAAATVEPADVPAAAEHMAAERATGEPKSSQTPIVRREIARAAAPAGDPGLSDCASHCCGGTANMTCCAAALVPEISVIPLFTASHALLFGRAGALLGLPPEALPKPPKPFA